MFASRVLPGAALVRATVWRQRAFNRLDLPTLERPANAICARPSRGISCVWPPAAALVTNSTLRSFKDPVALGRCPPPGRSSDRHRPAASGQRRAVGGQRLMRNVVRDGGLNV